MKTKKLKTLIKIIAFALVAAVLLEVLSVTVFTKKNGGTAYRNHFNKTYSYFYEPDNSIQVLGIGNSDLYSGFVPTKLWEDYGYTSQMMGSPHQTPLQSYYYLKDIFQKQSPEVVIIELDMLYNSTVDEAPEPEKNKLDVMFNYLDTDDFQAVIFNKLSIFTFHDMWKSIVNRDFDMRTPNSHGYKYFSAFKEVDVKPYMFKTDKVESVHENRLHQLDMMIDLCKQKGCEFFFVEMPTMTSWNYERHNAAVQLAEKYGVDFVDLNLLTDEMGLDLEISFRDDGNHLNYAGACTVTEYMGKYLRDNYNLENRANNPDYDYWNDSIAKFRKEMKKEDKRRADEQAEE
ncbi:MAG: SGNH/GDSL hydrolase family protein [Eubacterium sp.]|nr:SGNH/GDSL hydrolase family protein [Eubacterium sp.]